MISSGAVVGDQQQKQIHSKDSLLQIDQEDSLNSKGRCEEYTSRLSGLSLSPLLRPPRSPHLLPWLSCPGLGGLICCPRQSNFLPCLPSQVLFMFYWAVAIDGGLMVGLTGVASTPPTLSLLHTAAQHNPKNRSTLVPKQ